MLRFKKINSNINIYNTDNKVLKSNFWKFYTLHYLSVLQKTME